MKDIVKWMFGKYCRPGLFLSDGPSKGTEKVEDFTVADISGLRVCFGQITTILMGNYSMNRLGIPL